MCECFRSSREHGCGGLSRKKTPPHPTLSPFGKGREVWYEFTRYNAAAERSTALYNHKPHAEHPPASVAHDFLKYFGLVIGKLFHCDIGK